MRTCTICGSRRVQRRKIDIHLRDGTNIAVEADVCPSCGERYLDPEAIDTIRLARPHRLR